MTAAAATAAAALRFFGGIFSRRGAAGFFSVSPSVPRGGGASDCRSLATAAAAAAATNAAHRRTPHVVKVVYVGDGLEAPDGARVRIVAVVAEQSEGIKRRRCVRTGALASLLVVTPELPSVFRLNLDPGVVKYITSSARSSVEW